MEGATAPAGGDRALSHALATPSMRVARSPRPSAPRRWSWSARRAGRVGFLLLLALVGTAVRPGAAQAVWEPDAYAQQSVDVANAPASPSPRTVSVTTAGSCECDLRVGACDANCYCDPDCTGSDKSAFTAALPEGPPGPSLTYCLPKSAVATVNLPASSGLATVSRADARTDLFSQLLCIVGDNNPALGAYFLDPALPQDPASALDKAIHASTPGLLGSPVPYTQNAPSAYAVGSPVPAMYTSAAAPAGILTVPSPLYGGACTDTPVGFALAFPPPTAAGVEQRPDDAACDVVLPSLSANCQNYAVAFPGLAHTRVSDLRLATTTARSALVPLTNVMYYHIDPQTGAEVPLASPALPTWDASSSTCDNVLTSADITITYDLANRAVQSVTAAVQLTNVAADATGAGAVRQRFTVQWRQASEGGARGTSGRPGYLTGYPVQAGTLVQSGDHRAISNFPRGLPFPGAGPDGRCSINASLAVAFGMDASMSCGFAATVDELQATCGGGGVARTAPSFAHGMFGPTNANLPLSGQTIYLGIWGDADPLNITDWVPVTVDAIPATQTWDVDSQSCVNAVVGFELQILTAKVGVASTPQMKIEAARVSWKLGTWRWPDGHLPASTPSTFYLQSTVTYLPLDQGRAAQLAKSTPPLLPAVPPDYLYPFLVESNAPAVRAGAGVVAAAAVGVVVAIYGVGW